MPGLVRQSEAAGLLITDLQDPGLLDSHIQGHRTRKQDTPANLPPSPAKTIMVESLNKSDCKPLVKEEQSLTRSIERGTPGDRAIFSSNTTPERKELAKRKSQYYGDVFAVRASNTSARERIHREWMVMAEIRTNVIVDDEYTFITDLSYNLSSRYQRPESSILVTLTHSVCLLLGASFDPAYTLIITALPSQVQPVTNKRNAMLLAKLLQESLGVPPSRGLIKFVSVQEENFAVNGKTATAEIEDLEKEQADDNTNIKRSLSRMGPKPPLKRQSKPSMRNLKAEIAAGSGPNAKEPLSPNSDRSGRLTPPRSEGSTSPPITATPLPRRTPFNPTLPVPLPPVPAKKTALDKKAEKVQKLGRRKSFISGLFGR